MSESIIEQKVALAAYGVDGTILLLTALQQDTANEFGSLLKKFQGLFLMIMLPSHLSYHWCMLCRKLWKNMMMMGGVHRMKTEMLTSLQRQYSDMEATDCLALATIIDARF